MLPPGLTIPTSVLEISAVRALAECASLQHLQLHSVQLGNFDQLEPIDLPPSLSELTLQELYADTAHRMRGLLAVRSSLLPTDNACSLQLRSVMPCIAGTPR